MSGLVIGREVQNGRVVVRVTLNHATETAKRILVCYDEFVEIPNLGIVSLILGIIGPV